MNERTFNRILAVIFLAVGILASVNTIRLHTYIRDTIPRDLAQEQCQDQTLEVLKSWVVGRTNRDAADNARDDQIIATLQGALTSPEGRREQLVALQKALDDSRAARDKAVAAFENHPLPSC